MSMLNLSFQLSPRAFTTWNFLRYIGWRIGNAILVVFLLAGVVSAIWVAYLVLQAAGITAE